MYCKFFGLDKKPFNMTPDPAFLFLTAQHREALVGLTYSILERKGFVVLTGDAGTGKTTLLTRVLQHMPETKVQSSVILNPTLTPAEFLELALLDFGIPEVPASKAQRLVKMQKLLLEGHREGRISTLVIDEAHKLSLDVLEEVRLLGNFEQDDQKLLQILLVGQSELSDLLERSDLRQLKQRIALRFTIEPLPPDHGRRRPRSSVRARNGDADRTLFAGHPARDQCPLRQRPDPGFRRGSESGRRKAYPGSSRGFETRPAGPAARARSGGGCHGADGAGAANAPYPGAIREWERRDTLVLRAMGRQTGAGGLDTERHEQDFRGTESTTRRARGSRSIALGR